MTLSDEAPASVDAVSASTAAVRDDIGNSDAATESEFGEEMQPAELQGDDPEGDRRRRRRGRRGGRRRRRGQGQESHVPEQYAGERGPRLQLELRPGEPGYSGPAEEFGEEPDFVAAEEVAEGDLIETVPPKQDAQPHETQPAAERATPLAAAKEAPPAPSAASEAETEAERTPVAYNVSPPHEVSGPAPNPRRGWWRR